MTQRPQKLPARPRYFFRVFRAILRYIVVKFWTMLSLGNDHRLLVFVMLRFCLQEAVGCSSILENGVFVLGATMEVFLYIFVEKVLFSVFIK